MSPIPRKKLLSISWFPYILILFEMLYMATPFAVFFYSVYRLPMQLLNASDNTAWLLQTILPHFVATQSTCINFILHAGWLLMAIGLIIFFVGFIQIYYAKFTRKGAVTGGVYHFIRHPQYAAWITFGFGMCLVWSRFIVWLMYVSMIFIYYLLARTEEAECKRRFSDSYISYFKRTGMFFPKLFSANKVMPTNDQFRIPAIRTPFIIIMYCVALFTTLAIGTVVRTFTLTHLFSCSNNTYAAVSLTPMPEKLICETTETVMNDSAVLAFLANYSVTATPVMVYLIPENWSVAELGMEVIEDMYSGDRNNPQLNPGTHGNPPDCTQHKKKVLITKADVIGKPSHEKILQNLKKITPLLSVSFDLRQNAIMEIRPVNGNGIYGSIPVPVF